MRRRPGARLGLRRGSGVRFGLRMRTLFSCTAHLMRAMVDGNRRGRDRRVRGNHRRRYRARRPRNHCDRRGNFRSAQIACRRCGLGAGHQTLRNLPCRIFWAASPTSESRGSENGRCRHMSHVRVRERALYRRLGSDFASRRNGRFLLSEGAGMRSRVRLFRTMLPSFAGGCNRRSGRRRTCGMNCSPVDERRRRVRFGRLVRLSRLRNAVLCRFAHHNFRLRRGRNGKDMRTRVGGGLSRRARRLVVRSHRAGSLCFLRSMHACVSKLDDCRVAARFRSTRHTR
jgi:hypothetical protein